MSLTNKQLKYLSGLAHNLKPVIWLGQRGLNDQVMAEIESALDHHELIKIKLRVGDRDLRDRLIQDICNSSHAELVQRTGNIATLYRKNTESPVINLIN